MKKKKKIYYIFLGNNNCKILIRDLSIKSINNEVKSCYGHSDEVVSVAYFPNG